MYVCIIACYLNYAINFISNPILSRIASLAVLLSYDSGYDIEDIASTHCSVMND